MYFGHRRRGLGSKERRPIQFLLSRFRIFPATLVANVWKSREMLYGGYSKVFPIIVGRFC